MTERIALRPNSFPRWLALTLMSAFTLLAAGGLWAIAQTQTQAFQMSLFMLLPSILLSGFVFPFEGMPRVVQYLAQVLPLTHFVEMIRGVALRGATLAELQAPLVKLLIFTVLIVIAVTLRFHKRLD